MKGKRKNKNADGERESTGKEGAEDEVLGGTIFLFFCTTSEKYQKTILKEGYGGWM